MVYGPLNAQNLLGLSATVLGVLFIALTQTSEAAIFGIVLLCIGICALIPEPKEERTT